MTTPTLQLTIDAATRIWNRRKWKPIWFIRLFEQQVAPYFDPVILSGDWSFETEQRKKGPMNLQPYQQRVVDEKSALDDKINKLTAFLDGEVVAALPTMEQSRMERQLEAMTLYSSILGERIGAFTPDETCNESKGECCASTSPASMPADPVATPPPGGWPAAAVPSEETTTRPTDEGQAPGESATEPA